ncbi:RNA-directed DNA polymerase, eukaryota [Tanacetum coccineum]
MVRQKAILDLALQFDNVCTTKDDLRKAYEKCNDIPQESRALIDTFLKEESDKDYELNLSMYGKTAKIEKQTNAKLIGDVYLTEKELHQLHLDEEALRETLEEEARAEKEHEEKIRQKQADDELFMLEFWVKYDSEYEVVMSTQEYMKKVVKDVGEDEDFKSGRHQEFSEQWKLDQVVAIVKSCSPNVIGDLTVIMKDLSGTILGTIHHKFIGEGGCGKDITIVAALILANISVFSPKPSMHYLNITMRNVVKVFRKDTVPGSSSG